MFNPQMQTFEMSLDLNFLLLEGGPGGNVLFSGSDTLATTTQVPFHFGSLPDALTPRDNAFDAVLGAFGSGLAGFDFEGSFLSLNTSTAFATAIPEPSTFALTALGVLGTGWRRRKRA